MPAMQFISDVIIIAALYRILVISVESLGSVSVSCTDKHGTALTVSFDCLKALLINEHRLRSIGRLVKHYSITNAFL